MPKFLNLGLLFCNEIAVINKFRKIMHMEIGLPWPFVNRDVLVTGFGYDILDEGQILILVHSIDEYPDVDLPPKGKSISRMEINIAGALLTPISEEMTHFEVIGTFDPQVKVIPEPIANFIMKEIVGVAFRLFSKCAKSVRKDNSPHSYRIESKPEVYEHLKKRLELFTKKNDDN